MVTLTRWQRKRPAKVRQGQFTLDPTNSSSDPAKLAQLRRGATPPLHSVEAFMVSLAAVNDGP